MTLQQALTEGLMVTAIGLIIVFAVLIILMITMMIMKKVFYKEEGVQKADPQPVAVPQPAQVQEQPTQDENIIAVIAAAVAASLNTSTYNLKIRSIRRVGNNAPDWNKAGLRDTIDSKF